MHLQCEQEPYDSKLNVHKREYHGISTLTFPSVNLEPYRPGGLMETFRALSNEKQTSTVL